MPKFVVNQLTGHQVALEQITGNNQNVTSLATRKIILLSDKYIHMYLTIMSD